MLILLFKIDYLQQRNQDLQRQLDGALSKARFASDTTVDLDVRNAALERELQDVDFTAKQLQLDKDTVVRTADREIEDAKVSKAVRPTAPPGVQLKSRCDL